MPPATLISRSGENGSASGRESDLGLLQRALALDLDETVYQRVFPYGVPGTGTLPSLHGLGVSSMTTCDPGKEL